MKFKTVDELCNLLKARGFDDGVQPISVAFELLWQDAIHGIPRMRAHVQRSLRLAENLNSYFTMSAKPSRKPTPQISDGELCIKG